ncbi:gamma subclass chorismate mutase AroQ [Undibacterium flavidum]|uniref:chorismate mutase n=1 Tax=Undibacterium flavidum TaxID=2762297 RepID=A0ABR6Y931_9BURK|nr:gamma subclass chorismate mutase AroQ [Undibacterium flavidum]MBC3873110.1 gamma subclass chorismate mutase AroQ [Undibacterium flavidum]
MRFHYLFLLLGLTFSVGSTSTAQTTDSASTRLEQIKTRNTLRVGTTGDYKPFSYRATTNSPYIGFDIEMAQALANTLGVQLELVPTSWPTLMQDLASNRFDIAMSGISISAEREKVAMFSDPYLRDGKTPIVLCAKRERFRTLQQIDQPAVKVIVNPGGTNERFVRDQLRRAQIIVYPDNNHIFDQLAEGQADVMITDAVEARLQQQLKPTLCAIHPEQPFNLSQKAYLLPQDAAWKATIDHWLRSYVAGSDVKANAGADKLAQTMEKWLHHPWPSSSVDRIAFEPLRDLLTQRLALMESVARHKWNQQSAIEDLPREQKIILSLQQQATALGIPAAWAEHFFRAQIEAAKQLQREYFVQWQSQQQGQFADVPNLDTVIRPQLDQLTTQILRQLAMSWPALADKNQQSRIAKTMQSAALYQFSEKAAQMAVQALLDGSTWAQP